MFSEEKNADQFEAADEPISNGKSGTNWPLLAFIFFLPLVNVQHKLFPPLPGGINFMNVMFILSLAGAFWKGGEIHWERPTNRWIVGFIFYLIFSYVLMLFMLAVPIERSLNALKDFIFVISLTFIVQKSITSYKDVKYILYAILASLPYIFRVIFNQYQSVSRWHYSDSLRVNGTMVDLGANEMGAYMVTCSVLVIVLVFYLKPEKLWQKALLYMSVPFSLAGLMYTYSRGAYVAIFAAAIVFYFYKQNKGKLTLVLLALFIAAPVFLPVSVVERFQSINAEEGERDESAESRFVFWAAAFETAKSSPVFGYGYRSWSSPEINDVGMDTHNYFVKMVVEGGALGILVVVFLLLSISKLARSTIKQAPTQLGKGLGIVMLCATIGLVMGNMFGDRFSHPSVIFIYWVLCGVCIKVNYLQEEETEIKEEKPINIFDEE